MLFFNFSLVLKVALLFCIMFTGDVNWIALTKRSLQKKQKTKYLFAALHFRNKYKCLQLGRIFRTYVRIRTFLKKPVRIWSGFYFKSPEFMFSELSSSFLRRSNQSQMTAADIKYLAISKRSYTNKYLFDGNLKWYI